MTTDAQGYLALGIVAVSVARLVIVGAAIGSVALALALAFAVAIVGLLVRVWCEGSKA